MRFSSGIISIISSSVGAFFISKYPEKGRINIMYLALKISYDYSVYRRIQRIRRSSLKDEFVDVRILDLLRDKRRKDKGHGTLT